MIEQQRRRKWDWEVVVLVLVLCVLVRLQRSMAAVRYKQQQMRGGGVVDDHSHRVNEINGEGPYFALLMTYPTELFALESSGEFLPSSNLPFVHLAGRRFNIGKIRGVDIIYVMSGEQSVNAAITVQVLLDTFDIHGIVHYGIAGSTNDSLAPGDVSVMKSVAFTSSWKWKEFKSERGQLPELRFGAYNLPDKGENLLAKIEFTPTQLYSTTTTAMQEVFWLQIDSTWFNIAATQLGVNISLVDVSLQQCVNNSYCLPEAPKVVFGLKGSTADIFLDNAAYRKFLFDEFSASTVDEESAAVVLTCLSNGVPCIVFRGVSDMADSTHMQSTASLRELASINAFTTSVQFIELISKVYYVHKHPY